MRAILLAGSACLLAAAAASGQEPGPPPQVFTVPGGLPPELADPPPVAVPTDTRPFAMSGPRFWGSADYTLWWYTPMETVPLIQTVPAAFAGNSNPTGVAIFFPENSRVSFGAFSGVRANVGVSWDRFALELGGFTLQERTVRSQLFSNGTPFAVGQNYFSAGAGTDTFLYASLPNQYSGGVAAEVSTQLYGVEANVRRAWYVILTDSTDFLTGFRYLDLRESLFVRSPSSFPNGNTLDVRDSIRTRNMFYGWQVGFNGRIGGFDRGLGLDFTTKSAVGGVSQHADLVGSNTFVRNGVVDAQAGGLYARGLNAGSFSRGKIAYLSDLDVKLTYNFTPGAQVYVGYSLMYLSSVMRPGDAIDPVVNDQDIRFVAAGTPSTAARPAFGWRASELVVQGMTFGVRLQY